MANENVFSTPKESTPSPASALQAMIQRRALQAQNRQALAEAQALEKTLADGTAAMNAALEQSAKDTQKAVALESLAHQQGTRNIARRQIGLRQRIIAVGLTETRKKVLEELIYEAYWLDDAVKECTAEQITDSIENVMSYIDENFHGAKVAESNYSPLLKNVSAVIEGVVKKAADRICKAALESGDIDPDFELSDAEEDELDTKLGDLGRDEIVDLIRNKVASVVQDEKEKGQERSEMFKSLDGELNSEESEGGETDGDEELTDAEEAMLVGIRSGEITLEGATWDTLKVVFSDNKKKAKLAYNTAAKLAKNKRYSEAAKEYEKAKKIFKEMLDDVKSTDESMMSTVCSFLLSGWLEHAFIASIGGPSSAASITKVVCTSLSSVFGLMIPWTVISNIQTNEQNIKKDKANHSTNDYKIHAIAALNTNIDACDAMIKECNKKSRENGKGALEAAIAAVATESGYTPGERHFASMMKNGQELNLVAEDPTWNDFKVCISMLCKKARDLILKGRGGNTQCFYHAMNVMTDILKKISAAGENAPNDVKQFVLASTNLIFGPIPGDEAIISRFGVSLGSPETTSTNPEINWETVSWSDVEANVKTNIASASDWCYHKGLSVTMVVDDSKINQSKCPVSGKDSLAQKVAAKKNQLLNQGIGSSLFEALTISAIQNCKTAAMESGMNVSDEDTEDAALIEALLNYTIFETLDTIGLYNFRIGDMRTLQRTLVHSVTEGSSPFEKEKDKKGLNKVRINTRKMKQKRDINGNPSTNDKVAEM